MRDARTRDEQIRRADLAGAVGDAQILAADIDAIERRAEETRQAIATATQTRDRVLSRPTAAATIAHLEHYLRRLRRDLDDHLGEKRRALARHRGQLAVVDETRGRLILARAAREVVERHFAAWRTERRKLAERRED